MAQETVKYRWVPRFTWELVDSNVICALLDVPGSTGRFDRGALTKAAAQRFDKSRKRLLSDHAEVLRGVWLPTADADVVTGIALMVQPTISGDDRWKKVDTKSRALEFLNRRKLGKTMKVNIVNAFLAAHKEKVKVLVGPKDKELRSGLRLLEGFDANRPAPWPHQLQARQSLDRHELDSPNRGALIVLPTGSGKTETVADWLLDRMERDAQTRVLWIVHQQELVDQALERFAACASARRTGFVRQARAIHSAGAEIATLMDPRLDVACVTIQTLEGCLEERHQGKLATFLQRPTHVVVDEAHHAASPTYTEVLDRIDGYGRRCLLGLTATPWPTSVAAHHRLRKRFPSTIIEIDAEELMSQGILARPVLHTVDTGLRIYLDSKERAAAESSDFNPKTLNRLNVALRNEAIVRVWKEERERWAKTLVFAVNIAHADEIAHSLASAGAAARVIHSRSDESRRQTIDWFRSAKGSAVLVSVGMLNEGVDLPDAKTAFLARPTSSRILLRQMIGRVLRGPQSGGAAEAHIVWFQDGWENFGEVLHPSAAIPTVVEEASPPVTDEQGSEIPPDVEAEVAMLLAPQAVSPFEDDELLTGWVPVDPLLVSSRLTGYYELVDRRIPVFEHQEAAFNDLSRSALAASALKGKRIMSWFEDAHLPYPSRRQAIDVVKLVRELGESPPFTRLDAVVGPGVAVEKILAAGAITNAERLELIGEIYRSSLARAAYRSFDQFVEAVDQALRQSRRARIQIEQPIPTSVRPKLGTRPAADRDLSPRWLHMLRKAPSLLSPEVRLRLADPPGVEYAWTRRVVTTTWAHWSIRLTGKNAGRQVIRVNRLLRSTTEVVPDALLEYLLYHELLHHLLPGQGHDAEFYEHEARWPDYDALDLRLATFHEDWDTKPERYAEEPANPLVKLSDREVPL